jgi:uncharacterized membrane protein YbaN (DUF454 family)
MTLKKILFIVLGAISLTLGIIGIFVPGLPTTSFVLLTAYLWARSSEKLYNKLLNHKFLGGYIRDFQKGVSVRTKIRSVSIMWTMILISSFVFIQNWYIRGILLLVGIIGTIVMWRLPGPKEEETK